MPAALLLLIKISVDRKKQPCYTESGVVSPTTGIAMIDLRIEFQGTYPEKRTSTKFIVVHHAAALYPQSTARGDILAVHNYHRFTRGWPGIAYTLVCAETVNGGPVEAYQCSDLDTLRYHVAWHNDDSVGVAALTNFGSTIPEQKWIEALAEPVRLLKRRYPSAQIVGHREIALGPDRSPDGKDWRTQCPGTRWHEWKPRLLALVDRPVPPPPPASEYTADTPVLSAPTCTPEQAARYIIGKGPLYPPYDVRSILASYWHWCELGGVNPHVAVAQMCYETNVLRSWWSDRPRRNGAGIGVNGETNTQRRNGVRVVEGLSYPEWALHGKIWEKGISFPAWEYSARAHVGRLCAYAVLPNKGTTEQYALIVYALAVRDLPPAVRGVAPTIGQLGGKGRWAPNPDYWQGIVRHMSAMVQP